MSGGVSPSSDISLPRDEPDATTSAAKTAGKPPRRSLLTFRHLNALAVVVILSASGTVSLADLAFVVFSLIYALFLSRTAFPPTSPDPDPPLFGDRNSILGLYVSFAAAIGLFLPIAYILEGIYEGDKDGINAAAPHVFLLASQVFMEGVSFSGRFSLPVRVFVPVFYNSRRIFTIVEWMRGDIHRVEEEEYGGSRRRLYVGRGLAVANMAFWCFNLFGFLLPVYLPRAFRIYYSKSSKQS